MKKRLFMFLTPDEVTHSSCGNIYPDVDNFQVLGLAEGSTEEEAFEEFLNTNKWVFNTNFKNVICIEVKSRIHEGKMFLLDD
ncbi:hypothetical protein [Archaeoglobus sp.]